jgi:hypothetical protein
MGKKKHKVDAESRIKLRQTHHLTHPPMATPTISAANLSRVNAANSTTDWSSFSGAGVSLNGDIFIQGTGSIGRRIDNGVNGIQYQIQTTALDFEDGGAEEGYHIWVWINVLQVALINSVSLRIANTTDTDYYQYELFPANAYDGGWYRAVINPMIEQTTVGGSGASTAAIVHIGVEFDMGNVAGGALNCNVDAIDVGRGIIVTGGTTTDKLTWADIAAVASNNTNAYGVIEEDRGVFFCKGEIQLGDGSNDCYFEDTDALLVWESSLSTEDDGSTVNIGTSTDFNRLTLVEGTGTTDFINGIKTGSGDGASGTNGCTYQAAPVTSGIRTHLTIDFSDSDITNVDLFGTTFRRCVGDALTGLSITFSSDATNGPNHEVSGCLFDECGAVDPGRVSMQNNTFASNFDIEAGRPFLDVVAERQVTTPTWLDGTAVMSDRTLADFTPFDSVPSNNGTDDALYIGLDTQFIGYWFAGLTPPTSVSNKIWEYWDGSAWTSLGTITVAYGPSSVADLSLPLDGDKTRFGMATWSLPTDWALTSVNNGPRLYYARMRYNDDFFILNPAPDCSWIYAIPTDGAALVWNANQDVVNCLFAGNADADSGEKAHGIQHQTSGAFTYNGMTFSGNDADILNSAPAVLTDSYADTNQDTDQTLGNGTINGIGQSFTGNGDVLTTADFYLKKSGTPTGNATAKLYAHSGTFGTSSVPTGAALATSETFDVSTLTGTYTHITFTFTDDFLMVNTTKYVIAIEYTSGDGSNFVQVGTDASSPSHGGNKSQLNGSWVAASGTDVVFEVWGDAVVVNASGGANPTTSTEADPDQATFINNNIDVTLTGLIASPPTEVRVYEAGTTIEIDGAENVVTGSFTFSAPASASVDIVIHNVGWEHLRVEGFTVPSVDTSIPVTQFFDRVYENP